MKEEQKEKLRFRDQLIKLMYKFDCSVVELNKLTNNTDFWLLGTDYKLKRDRILKELVL